MEKMYLALYYAYDKLRHYLIKTSMFVIFKTNLVTYIVKTHYIEKNR